MGIKLVKVRAKICVGSMTVRTPYIQSFNVRKSRNQRGTFDASLKVRSENISTGGKVVIYAGSDSGTKKIFTGILKTAKISPCWNDPGFVFLNISGTDVLSRLANKKYTRRCRATKSTWVTIDSPIRSGLRDGKFARELDTMVISPDTLTAGDIEKSTTPVIDQIAGKTFTSPAQYSVLIDVERKSGATI